VVPARSSRHRLSCARAIPAAVRQKRHLSPCPNSPSQLSGAGGGGGNGGAGGDGARNGNRR
jgi:hypothetical protein